MCVDSLMKRYRRQSSESSSIPLNREKTDGGRGKREKKERKKEKKDAQRPCRG
ncbi:hypothetical protein WH47_04706 [Habropoda laboriosa]|uniref:Uncharacterized protein n=1 Tax=Habropoda laboriosa TaxID=597456 RepID=A0A0L7R2W3_9HYME|nr:hypothetical protein WH47_04706 [Habropoda laboriosa]